MMTIPEKPEFVIDNSVVMTWAFEDEVNRYANKVLESISDASVMVPGIWRLEVVNVLISAERRKRITEAESKRFLALLDGLQFQVVDDGLNQPLDILLSIARDFKLSSYDAAYLHLAINHGLPIATLDKNLTKAAKQAKIPLWLK